METIIFATKNKGKIKEINEILADMDVNVISMEEAGITIDVVEDGKTFEEALRTREGKIYHTVITFDPIAFNQESCEHLPNGQ